MRPRWRKVLADFWDNKARSLMIIASITIGVFAVGVVGIGYIVIPESMVQSYLSTNPANIQIQTDLFDEDFIKTIRTIDGVEEVEGRVSISARAKKPGTDEWLSIRLTAIDDFSDQRIKKLSPVSGKTNPAEKEVILLADSLESLPIYPGSPMQVELMDGTNITLDVVGTALDYSSDLAITFNQRLGLINLDTLEYLHHPRLFDTLVVTISGDKNDLNQIESVAGSVTEQVENSGRRILNKDINRSIDQPYANYTDAVSVIIGFIGLFILVLSSALVINTMNALMAQHIRQIGVIKLIGGERKQIIGMYLVLVVLFSLISLLIAIPASAFVGQELAANILPVLNGKLQTNDQLIFLPTVIMLQIVVALLIPLLAAFIPIVQGASVPIQKALSAKLIKNEVKQSRFDRWLENIRSKDGVITLGIRNTFRQKGRLALTIFTLSLGSAIFISVFNVELSLDKQIERVTRYNQADIYLEMEQKYPVKEMSIQLSRIPGVVYSEPWLTTYAQLKTKSKTENVNLVAPPDNSPLVSQVVNEGRWVNPDENHTIVVNDAFWNTYPDLKPGDQILLEIRGKEDYWTVVGIFHYTGLDEKFAYTTFGTLAKDLNSPNHTSTYRVVTAEHTLSFQMDMAQKIKDQLTSAGYNVVATTAQQEIVKEGLEKMNVIIYVLLFLSVLTGIVGGIGLSGTLSLNVLERTAEIGILRAIGAYNKIITRLVMFESLFIGLTSYLIGIIISFPISYVLTNLVNLAIFGASSAFVITPKGFILWFFILLVLSLVASYFPAKNAASLTIREVLAYE